MKSIHIEWLTDSHDCETCGTSYAEGAKVSGDVTLELIPSAHCYGGADYNQDEVYRQILGMLGYRVEETY